MPKVFLYSPSWPQRFLARSLQKSTPQLFFWAAKPGFGGRGAGVPSRKNVVEGGSLLQDAGRGRRRVVDACRGASSRLGLTEVAV